jgi:hypothetical protein
VHCGVNVFDTSCRLLATGLSDCIPENYIFDQAVCLTYSSQEECLSCRERAGGANPVHKWGSTVLNPKSGSLH